MKKKTRSKIKYTDDKGEMDGKWRIVRRGELPEFAPSQSMRRDLFLIERSSAQAARESVLV